MGGSILGPQNGPVTRENPFTTVPPKTDHGTLPNLKWSFADSHMRLENGGWARQTTVRELPVSDTMAGVNMRLNKGGVREMHWHKASEWSYMLAGRARITAIDEEGRTFVDDVGPGDLWFFPSGIPHSIQGLDPDGCEFLLVFDDGSFSEDNTFLLTDWLSHTPRDIVAKNFGLPESTFAKLPEKELYIFEAPLPTSAGPDADMQPGPAGRVPRTFSHRMTAQEPIKTNWGSVRITDSRNFPASTTTAAALVDVNPGGLRELHWHPNAAEWQFFIEGQARMTVFASGGDARTFDYQAGDVGYVPFAMGHYIENTGSTPLRFLEMFKSDRYADLSLTQWLALTPPELVVAHLNIDKAVLQSFSQVKRPVVG
ncbi:oxalate decarboxylase family bicupin [Hyphomicrobiales bacterium BP6-180914]|uniref:Oxalate decarboxylase family bicupin n=2 Tax=Lichenifustis flavocetrariae TaxID=2949735 RepID=A0AA42CIQ8_9HYPH|nr:oxalate decarboxylase family bicupin [Lichenifustis flavocetrariae]